MTASATAEKTEWRISGEEIGSCNCVWACPCQFNGLPDKGNCEAFVALQIEKGHFGSVSLDGTTIAQVFHWPGPVHEGNGTRLSILDEKTTPEQREALLAMLSGKQGHPFFEIFAAVTPNLLEPKVAPIRVEVDREKRVGSIKIEGIGETRIEPIKNPVTGEEHRVRIDLPSGFEYRQAEIGNSVSWKTTAGGKLDLQNENSYAQLNRFDWSSDGTTR